MFADVRDRSQGAGRRVHMLAACELGIVLVLALAATGCALGGTRGGDAGGLGLDGAGLDGAGLDGGAPRDATVVDGGRTTDGGRDAGAAMDAGVDAARGTDGGSLSPELALPDPSGELCTYPGSLGECPGIQVCRFYSSADGRCESCEPCGNLNAPCSSSSECDILFMCFRGRCTNFCTLGLSECGPPDDCLDIGHPTRGVCRP